MEMNIVNEVAALQRLSIGQLRQRFAELFGEATNASNRTWLIKRIVWRMQALAEGDLSQRARQRAAELARDADLRLNPPPSKATTTTPPAEPVSIPTPVDQRLPPPGTILTRPYKGQLVQVQVLTRGNRSRVERDTRPGTHRMTGGGCGAILAAEWTQADAARQETPSLSVRDELLHSFLTSTPPALRLRF